MNCVSLPSCYVSQIFSLQDPRGFAETSATANLHFIDRREIINPPYSQPPLPCNIGPLSGFHVPLASQLSVILYFLTLGFQGFIQPFPASGNPQSSLPPEMVFVQPGCSHQCPQAYLILPNYISTCYIFIHLPVLVYNYHYKANLVIGVNVCLKADLSIKRKLHQGMANVS